MFNKLGNAIIGVIENMSYLECQHCNNKINIFGTGGSQKISDQFNVPFIGEIPLHQQIMSASDSGNPVTIAEPNDNQAVIFDKISRTVAGRISIIASELQEQEKTANEQSKEHQSVNTACVLEELKKPLGKLILDSDITERKIRKEIAGIKHKIITVGDRSTERLISFDIYPDLAIIDGVERRQEKVLIWLIECLV